MAVINSPYPSSVFPAIARHLGHAFLHSNLSGVELKPHAGAVPQCVGEARCSSHFPAPCKGDSWVAEHPLHAEWGWPGGGTVLAKLKYSSYLSCAVILGSFLPLNCYNFLCELLSSFRIIIIQKQLSDYCSLWGKECWDAVLHHLAHPIPPLKLQCHIFFFFISQSDHIDS